MHSILHIKIWKLSKFNNAITIIIILHNTVLEAASGGHIIQELGPLQNLKIKQKKIFNPSLLPPPAPRRVGCRYFMRNVSVSKQ